MSTWTPLEPDYNYVKVESVKFLYSLALARFNSTHPIKDVIENKAFKLFNISIVLTLIAFAFIFNNLQAPQINLELFIPVTIFFIGYLAVIYLLIYIFKPKDFYVAGNEPKKLWVSESFTTDEKKLILTEIYHLQSRIEFNESQTDEMRDHLNITITLMLLVPALSIFSLFLVRLYLL